MLIRHGARVLERAVTATTTGGAWWSGATAIAARFEYFVRELGYAVLPWIALAPAALAAAVMRRVRRAAARRRRRRRGRGAPAGHLLVRRDLVRRRLRAGVDVDHQVPPLHPARHPGPGDRDRLLPRRSPRRGATAAPAPPPRSWASRCWRWCWSIWPARRRTRSASSGCSRTTTSTRPSGRPWPPALDFRAPLIVFGVAVRARDAGAGAGAASSAGRRSALCLAAVAFTFFLLDDFMRARRRRTGRRRG